MNTEQNRNLLRMDREMGVFPTTLLVWSKHHAYISIIGIAASL